MTDILLPGAGRGAVSPAVAPPVAMASSSVAGLRLTPQSPATLLGANLKAEWDCRSGTAANTWTDAITSAVLTGSGSPTFAADPGYFNGLSVWQMSGAQLMDTGNLAAALVAASTATWMCLICRQPSPGSNKVLFTPTNTAAQAAWIFGQSAATPFALTLFAPSTNSNSAFAPDAAVHRYEFGCQSSSSGRTLVKDGVLIKFTSGSSNRVLQRVVMPQLSETAASLNVACLRIADTWPTNEQREQMRAYDRAIFGTL